MNEMLDVGTCNGLMVSDQSYEAASNTHPSINRISQYTRNSLVQKNSIEDVPSSTNYKIPVRVNQITSELQELNKERECNNIFVGVTRKQRLRGFSIGNIDSKSTKAGIVHYVENKGVKVNRIALFNGRNNTLSAKINVENTNASLLEQKGFWPANVFCRRWMSNTKWQKRFERETNGFGRSDYYDYNEYHHD